LGSNENKDSMAVRRVFCSVVEGLVWSDRCLYKLRKMINGSKACESCILRELERLKSAKANVSNDAFTSSDISDRGTRKGRGKRGHKRRSKLIGSETSSQAYSVQELTELLGKARRTIQDYAKKGRIPAQKAGKSWSFPKEEIDHWISKKKDKDVESSPVQGEEETSEFQGPDFTNVNQEESEKEA
jgi:excisionase family DNA binding protein